MSKHDGYYISMFQPYRDEWGHGVVNAQLNAALAEIRLLKREVGAMVTRLIELRSERDFLRKVLGNGAQK